jgi:hypothetical protein
MLKSVTICAALILAAAAFADSAEARQGFGGGRSMGGFGGARMGGLVVPAWAGLVVLAPWPLLALGEWESPVRAGSLVLWAWVQAALLGRAEVIGPATGGLVIGAGGIGAVDVSGPGGA